jgi:hypothetical protein
MATQRGTLHIARKFYTTEGQGVYDVVFTRHDQPEPDPRPVIRRFWDDQELADFLVKRLHRDPNDVRNIMRGFSEKDHADIRDLEMDENELRQLKLAA